MKLTYFHQAASDPDDERLERAKARGFVPSTCLLGGAVVEMFEAVNQSPCSGCNGPRERCQGKPQESFLSATQRVEQDRIRALIVGEDETVNSVWRLFR